MVTANINKQTAEVLITYRVVPDVPLKLSIIAGDCVHNARSALDNLICALIRRDQPSSECDDSAFPICTDSVKYPRQRARFLNGVPEQAKTLIEWLQPCNPAWITGASDHPLATLNQLSNRDKHRAPNIACGPSLHTVLTFAGGNGIVRELIIDRPLHSGAPELISGVPVEVPRDAEVTVDGATAIVFADGAVANQIVYLVLVGICEFLEKVVLPRFEPFFNDPPNLG